MNVRHTLICVFFLSLQDENTGLINAYTVYGRTEGGDVKVKCSYSESWKFFCRDECKEKDVLIVTNLDKHQSGRYSIKSRAGSLYVTITQLTKSDSGLYRCGSGTTQSSRSSYEQFKITVVDAKLDGNEEEVTTIYKRPGGNIVVQCSFTNSGDRKYFCKNGCEEKDILVETTGDRVEKDRYSIEFIKGSSPTASLYVGITQLTKSDSGLYQCVLDISLSPDPIRKFNIIVTDPTTSKPPSAFTTPVPSASTLTSTQSDQQLTGTTPSPAATTSKPNWTHRPFTTPVPSASTPTTPTQSLSSSSGSFTPSSAFPETTEFTVPVYHPGYFLPLVVCVSLVGVLIAVLLLLYIRKTRRHFTLNSRNMELPVVYKNSAPASTCEDSTNESSKD